MGEDIILPLLYRRFFFLFKEHILLVTQRNFIELTYPNTVKVQFNFWLMLPLANRGYFNYYSFIPFGHLDETYRRCQFNPNDIDFIAL